MQPSHFKYEINHGNSNLESALEIDFHSLMWAVGFKFYLSRMRRVTTTVG